MGQYLHPMHGCFALYISQFVHVPLHVQTKSFKRAGTDHPSSAAAGWQQCSPASMPWGCH